MLYWCSSLDLPTTLPTWKNVKKKPIAMGWTWQIVDPVTWIGSQHSEESKDFVIDQADVLQDGKISKMELTLGSEWG